MSGRWLGNNVSKVLTGDTHLALEFTLANLSKGKKVEENMKKIPWRRAWQPTPVFLPGESHGQRSLAGYSPQGHKELDTTEAP